METGVGRIIEAVGQLIYFSDFEAGPFIGTVRHRQETRKAVRSRTHRVHRPGAVGLVVRVPPCHPARLGDLVDEPELGEALGRQRVAGQRELHHHVVRHAPRQAQERPARGHQRALGLGYPQFRPPGGHQQVACQGDLQSARHREALDRRDQRLARRTLSDPREAAVSEPRRLAADERPQVHARAEEAAGAREHAHRKGVVPVQLIERSRHPSRQSGVDRVPYLGPVERYQQDVLPPLRQHGRGAVGGGHCGRGGSGVIRAHCSSSLVGLVQRIRRPAPRHAARRVCRPTPSHAPALAPPISPALSAGAS